MPTGNIGEMTMRDTRTEVTLEKLEPLPPEFFTKTAHECGQAHYLSQDYQQGWLLPVIGKRNKDRALAMFDERMHFPR